VYASETRDFHPLLLGLDVVERGFLDHASEDFKTVGRNLFPPAGRFTRDEMLRLFTPMTYLDGTAPPYFLSHGGRDDQVPASTFTRFTARLSGSGVRHHVAFHPNAGHSQNAEELRETFLEVFRFLDGLPH
jgi:dipeptidyl aminopeptidase/acylaminoacyl peptidase